MWEDEVQIYESETLDSRLDKGENVLDQFDLGKARRVDTDSNRGLLISQKQIPSLSSLLS
jgi:hypothetical protein